MTEGQISRGSRFESATWEIHRSSRSKSSKNMDRNHEYLLIETLFPVIHHPNPAPLISDQLPATRETARPQIVDVSMSPHLS